MDYVTEFLAQYSTAQMFFAYCLLLFLTLLGTVPNNSDITIIAGSLLVGVGKFELIPFVTAVIALVLMTENITFFTGYFWGNKIKRWNIIKKIFPEERQKSLEDHTHSNAFKVLFSIRITPLLRPVFYFMLGSLRLKPKTFWKFHTPMMLVYVSGLIAISVLFGNVVQTYLSDYKEVVFVAFIIFCFAIIKLNLKKKNAY